MKTKRVIFVLVCVCVLFAALGMATAAKGSGNFRMDDPFGQYVYTTINVTAHDGGLTSDRYGFCARMYNMAGHNDAQNYSANAPIRWTLKKKNHDHPKTIKLYWGNNISYGDYSVWSLKGGVRVYCGFSPQAGDKYYCGMVEED